MSGSPPVFVMGATGRVGGAIVEVLTERGVPVRAAVRAEERIAEMPGVEPVRFDLLDPGTWAPAVGGARRMFVMWPPGTSPSEHVFPFVDAAAAGGVQRAAFLSVLGADRMGFLPHHKVEEHLLSSTMSTVLLRSGYFFQNFTSMHRDDIRLRDEICLPSGNGHISMVDVRDVAEAAVAGLLDRRDDVAWDLTGPEALNMDDIAATLTKVLGRTVTNRNPGIVRFVRSQAAQHTPWGLTLFMIAEYTHARLGLAGRLGDGVQEALGRPPRSFEVFASEARECWDRQRC